MTLFFVTWFVINFIFVVRISAYPSFVMWQVNMMKPQCKKKKKRLFTQRSVCFCRNYFKNWMYLDMFGVCMWEATEGLWPTRSTVEVVIRGIVWTSSVLCPPGETPWCLMKYRMRWHQVYLRSQVELEVAMTYRGNGLLTLGGKIKWKDQKIKTNAQMFLYVYIPTFMSNYWIPTIS